MYLEYNTGQISTPIYQWVHRGDFKARMWIFAHSLLMLRWLFCFFWGFFMVFNATFNNSSAISWRSILLVEETGGPGENHRPVKLYHIILYTLPWSRFELTTPVMIGTDFIGSCKSQGRIRGGAPGASPPKIGKNMIFWRKIVIFHTKYPKNFRASLRSAQFF
jgi:hypothetical protein